MTEPAVRVICLKSHSNQINVNGLVMHNNHFASSSCQCGELNTSSTYFLQQRRVVSIITSWTIVEDPGIFRTETDKNTHTVALFLTRTVGKRPVYNGKNKLNTIFFCIFTVCFKDSSVLQKAVRLVSVSRVGSVLSVYSKTSGGKR